VLNIGANTGQFVSELRLIGYKNRGELSLVPLYEGGKLWLEMIERLNSEGFTLWAIQKGFTDPRDGRTLQVDAIFFRLDEK
jgi:hypothetical protein